MRFILVLLLAFSGSVIALTNPKPPATLIYSDMVPAPQRQEFTDAVILTADRLHIEPDWLMIVMRFETGGSFRPNIKNKYSGAVGLIQFLPRTANNLGTTPNKLAAMNLVQQLAYVEKYFAPYAGRMQDVYDVYLVVFAPAFLGQKDKTVLYRANSPTLLGRQRYNWNKSLDTNKDGVITIKDVKKQIRKVVPNSI